MNRIRRLAILACLALLAWPHGAVAGTSGKITGVVTDKSGKPIAGANIAVPAARRGALTDDSGEYVILDVGPGACDVVARMLGKRNTTTTGVVVSADRTTRIDITMEEEALELKGVEIVARRPLVESDLTSTRYVVRGEDIAKLPVQDLQEVVNLQAGVVDGHFRGGRSGEVQYQVSGVPVNNLYDNSAGLKLDRSVLQEVQVISGTFDAEYGQALSGVVNAVLKSGGDQFQWNAEAYTGNFVFDSNGPRRVEDVLDPFSIHQLQASISGPTVLPGTTYLLSARLYHFDDYVQGRRLFRPTDRSDFETKQFIGTGDGSDVALGYSHDWSAVGKLAHRFGDAMTLSWEGVFEFSRTRRTNFAWRYNPDGLNTQRSWNLVHGFDWNQRLSPKSFYNVSVRQIRYDYHDWAFADVFDPRYNAAGPPRSDPAYADGAVVQGVELNRFQQVTKSFVGKGAWSSQVSRYHLVKIGGELQLPEIRFGAPGTIVEGTVNGVGGLVRHVNEPPDFPNVAEYKPVLAAAFAQDQVEWRGLTARGGLRMEYFDSRSRIPSDLANPANSISGAPTSIEIRPHRRVSVAPRFGISYPVGPRAAVFFSYGHFYQLPSLGDIFSNANYSVLSNLQAGEQRFAVFGNPAIEPEFTAQYEFGYKHAITDDLGLDFTAFYKDIRNLLGVEFVSTYAAGEYARLTNIDFGNVLGVTLALDRRNLGPLTATLDYTWQIAQGNSSDPRETATRAEANEDPRPRLIPLNWDQRHTLNVTLTLDEPRRWTASSVIRVVSGQPYSPDLPSGATGALEANSGRKPNAVLVDLRGERSLGTRYDLRLFARGFNVFDTRSFNGFVFTDTGSPDYTRQPDTRKAQLADPTRFYAPRRIEIGVSATGLLGGGGGS